MSIAGFIREQVLQPRLAQSGCLVVYDEERRYRGIVPDMASDKVCVVDASESSIESRELAVTWPGGLGKGSINGLIVYVPAPAPLTDEAKQADPFSAVRRMWRCFSAQRQRQLRKHLPEGQARAGYCDQADLCRGPACRLCRHRCHWRRAGLAAVACLAGRGLRAG